MRNTAKALILLAFSYTLVSAPLFGEEPLSSPVPTSSQDLGAPSIQTTVQSIQNLESLSDPKCYATANRVENYLFGTPMTDSARNSKISLQKEWVLRIWRQASTSSTTTLSADEINVIIEKQFKYRFDDRDLIIERVGQDPIHIQINQYEHYSSIAYSLRAILSVKQDLFLGLVSYPLAILSIEAEEAIRKALDVASVMVLKEADESARHGNLKSINHATYVESWRRYFDPEESSPIHKTPKVVAENNFATFRSILDEKINAYEHYNEVDRFNTKKIDHDWNFFSYLKKAYAKHDLPEKRRDLKKLFAELQKHWQIFARELWLRSEGKAAQSESRVIRAEHATEALQELLPHHVDQYEDVVFFPTLSDDDSVMIHAYDFDSFRDFGLHWQILNNALMQSSNLRLEPDPFAAEIFAEGTAQFAVLLMHLSGVAAKNQSASTLESSVTSVAMDLFNHKVVSANKTQKVNRIVFNEGIVSATPSKNFPPEDPIFEVHHPPGFKFTHQSSDYLIEMRVEKRLNFIDFSGGGIAAEDINQDGFPDLFLAGGGGNKLLMNTQEMGFIDKTASYGLSQSVPGEARQPIFADFDNDGDQDLLIIFVRQNHKIYENLGDGKMKEVRLEEAALGGKYHVGGPATVFDYNRDGLLDIYIGYYGNYIRGTFPSLKRNNLNASKNHLFENQGQFHFKDVTRKSKTGQRGWAQAVVHSDINSDGWQDLIISNDFGSNVYYLNMKNGTFRDIAKEFGLDSHGHSMNVGVSDLNRDGFPDYFISNIGMLVKDNKYTLPYEETQIQFDPIAMSNVHIMESNFLHLSRASGALEGFEDSESIRRSASYTGWAWDADFFDYDNDGDEDLYLVNGAMKSYTDPSTLPKNMHVYPVNYGDNRNVLYENKDNELYNISSESGADVKSSARSAAYLDYDHDGDLDIAINNYESEAQFLVNRSDVLGNHWVKIRLVGNPAKKSNSDAIGATMVLTTSAGDKIWREVRTSTGFMSQHPKAQHIGLGSAEKFELFIQWPNGEKQHIRNLSTGKIHTIKQAA